MESEAEIARRDQFGNRQIRDTGTLDWISRLMSSARDTCLCNELPGALFTFLVFQVVLRHGSRGRLTLVGAVTCLVVAALVVWFRERREDASCGSVWGALVGLMAGLWLFEVFRCAGWVWWPLGRAARLWEYAFLLYSHVVLVLTVGACLLWSACRNGLEGRLSWGTARGWPLLTGLGIVLWLWPGWVVMHTRPHVSGPLGLLIAIAFAKACLTGIGEEACYRGLLQRAAVRGSAWRLG